MYVVLVDRQPVYPVTDDLVCYGPFPQKLAARDFAITYLHETGDHTEVLEIKRPLTLGGDSD